MNLITAIFSVLLLVLAIVLIIIVILQDSQETGLSGAIGGSSDTFLSKNKSRTMDAFLNKWTKVVAVAFFIAALVCDLLCFANL